MSPSTSDLHGLNLDGLLAEGLREIAAQTVAAWTPPTPEELAGLLARYEVVRLIGRGGMGAVYKARQADLARRVAIKILPPELGENEAFAERFRREAQALGRLAHPNILEVFEFGESAAGHLFYSMPYVDGGDLGSRLKSGPLQPVEALRIVKEICAALEAAHAQGIIHRDLKPANILLTADGTVKVADFGIAVLADQPMERLTHTGMAVGTMEYAAPEQAAGETVDRRSDLYSVGVICYETLTGKLPRGVFDPPSKLNAAVAPAVDDVVRTAMQNDPARRFQNAGDMWAALHRSEMAPLAELATPRGYWAWAAAVALVAVAAIVHWWPAQQTAQPATVPPAKDATPLPRTRALLPEEAESERLFSVLEQPSATTAHARNWAGANESAGLAVTRNFDGDNSALAYYTNWISRLEQKRASAPDEPRWMVALAHTLTRRGNILEGADPAQGVKTFEIAQALFRRVLKAAPDDPAARRDFAGSLAKALDSHRRGSAPVTALAACREVIAASADLPGRQADEAWFDLYLGTCLANSLNHVVGNEPALRPQVQTTAQAALAAVFERPSAAPVTPGSREAIARDLLRTLAQ